MSHIASDFRAVLEAEPHKTFRVIVRTVDSPTAYVDQAKASGLTVHHVYKLMSGMAVSGRGESLLRLSQAPWVESIEPDKTVRAL